MRVVVAHENSGQAEQTRQLLLGMGLECGAADCVSYSDLAVRLSHGSPDLLLVRVGEDALAAHDSIRQALALTQAPILAMGPTPDAQHILETMQVGAREYLDEDRLQPGLEAALNKLRGAGAVTAGKCQIVGVVSATPGSGVSTVATNLAFTWAETYRDKVALLELGNEPSALALSLDLEPRYTVADVAANWQRMDASFLRQSMTPHPGGVQVLPYKPETLEVPTLDAQVVRKTLILLRTMYSAVVLDLGHLCSEEHYEAMRLCDLVAVVVRLDVPALRQTRRFLRICGEHGVPTNRVRLIANRYGQKGQVSWKKAEEAIGAKFAEYIPEDSGKLNNALNKGLPLVRLSRHGSLARRLYKLAKQLNGQR
jgi:pilus assembly protein CpaE